MFALVYDKQAEKALRHMPTNWGRRIREKMHELAKDPYARQNNATRLQGRKGYRLRVGDWRILYDIEDDRLIVRVLDVCPRGSAYDP